MERKPVILCGGNIGRAVIFGWVDEIPEVGASCELHSARMILYWPAGCGGLFGLATNGPKKGLRLTSKVDKVRDTCRQLLTVSKEAAKEMEMWPDE